jgi:hypothetical protein
VASCREAPVSTSEAEFSGPAAQRLEGAVSLLLNGGAVERAEV